MDAPIRYRKIQKSDVNQVSAFIESVFIQFVAPEFSNQGIDEFLKYIQPETLINHFEKNHFGILASAGAMMVGVIVVRNDDHIALFFVDSRYQRKGIGKELFRRALEHCGRCDIRHSQITVNSSPNAVDAYRKLHFEPTDGEQCVNGIRFVPMTVDVHQSGNS